ncbi:MAG: hypothetical protein K6F86_08490 [Lachnospiraceae bacterium]|nr:hypothetical protein [Lachnospiraceae bacterium]
MYFSKNAHFLSAALKITALIRLSTAGIEGIIRMILNRSAHYNPDMLDSLSWGISSACSFLKIAAIITVFYLSWKKIRKYTGLIDEDDRFEMGRLQKEVFGSDLAVLSADAIEQLILIWGMILGLAECVYYVLSLVYRKFITQLMVLSVLGQQYDSFVPLYNLSHGFKYIQMMTAILIGVAVTAVFLHDRALAVAAGVLMITFLLAFSLFQMQPLSFSGRQIVVVWTSVIFHLTETLGLLTLSVYLAKHYLGL